MTKLADLITPAELCDELEHIKKKMTQGEAFAASEALRDYALAINSLMSVNDFMCTMGVLTALERILERKAKAPN